jgi:hypothetical protein
MTLVCPTCNTSIANVDVNITTDLAKCNNCGSIHKVSSLVANEDEKYISTPPNGSLIALNKNYDGTIELYYPPTGFSFSDIFYLIFSIFWVGFICFWTWGALQASIFFALFSIPFWFVGISMWIGLINRIFESERVYLAKEKIILAKNRPIGSKTIEYTAKEIVDIKLTPLKMTPFSTYSHIYHSWNSRWSRGAGIEMPAILSGFGTEYFFERSNDAEQEWVIKYIRNYLKKTKK